MGLPGHRRTSSDKRKRAAHFAIKAEGVSTCPKCQKPVKAHRACAICGTYKGKQVVDVARRTRRTDKKNKAKK